MNSDKKPWRERAIEEVGKIDNVKDMATFGWTCIDELMQEIEVAKLEGDVETIDANMRSMIKHFQGIRCSYGMSVLTAEDL